MRIKIKPQKINSFYLQYFRLTYHALKQIQNLNSKENNKIELDEPKIRNEEDNDQRKIGNPFLKFKRTNGNFEFQNDDTDNCLCKNEKAIDFEKQLQILNKGGEEVETPQENPGILNKIKDFFRNYLSRQELNCSLLTTTLSSDQYEQQNTNEDTTISGDKSTTIKNKIEYTSETTDADKITIENESETTSENTNEDISRITIATTNEDKKTTSKTTDGNRSGTTIETTKENQSVITPDYQKGTISEKSIEINSENYNETTSEISSETLNNNTIAITSDNFYENRIETSSEPTTDTSTIFYNELESETITEVTTSEISNTVYEYYDDTNDPFEKIITGFETSTNVIATTEKKEEETQTNVIQENSINELDTEQDLNFTPLPRNDNKNSTNDLPHNKKYKKPFATFTLEIKANPVVRQKVFHIKMKY